MIRNDITREYLENTYVKQQWSTVKIGKELGCDPTSVRYRLTKFGIQTRNFSNSHRINGYKFIGDKEILYGSLLGDGCLLRRNKQTGQSMASFSKANIGYDHVLFVANALIDEASSRIYEYHPKGGQTTFKITTRTCEELLEEYEKWYPLGEKIVPRSLSLTPKMILHWFMDDGHSCWSKNRRRVVVAFSTESFIEADCEFLSDQLDAMGVGCYLGKSHGGYGYKIFVRGGSVGELFKLIGSCPHEIPSMQYKWKIPL